MAVMAGLLTLLYQHGSKKGTIMSSIENLKAQIAKLEAGESFNALLPKSSGWLSRKLVIALAIIGALIFIGRDNIALTIWATVILGGIYLVTQAAHDIFQSRDDRITRCELIKAMAQDGLTKEELESISGKTEKA